MFSNIRHPVLLFILSYIGVMLGLLFKIMHWPGGSQTIGSMIMVQGIAIIWLIILLLKRRRQR